MQMRALKKEHVTVSLTQFDFSELISRIFSTCSVRISVVLMGYDQVELLVGDLRCIFCQSLVDRFASLLIGANFPGFK